MALVHKIEQKKLATNEGRARKANKNNQGAIERIYGYSMPLPAPTKPISAAGTNMTRAPKVATRGVGWKVSLEMVFVETTTPTPTPPTLSYEHRSIVSMARVRSSVARIMPSRALRQLLAVGGCGEGRAPFEEDTGLDRREAGRFEHTQPTPALPLHTRGASRRLRVQETASSAAHGVTNELCQDLWGHRSTLGWVLPLARRGPSLRGLVGRKLIRLMSPQHVGEAPNAATGPSRRRRAQGQRGGHVGVGERKHHRSGTSQRLIRLSSSARVDPKGCRFMRHALLACAVPCYSL